MKKKSLLDNTLLQWLLGFLIFVYITLIRWTCRFRVHGLAELQKALPEKRNVIIAFWHSRIAMAPFGRAGLSLPISMLISQHRDGQIIGKCVRFLGIRSLFFAPGSENKGFVLRHVLHLLKKGHSVGITPDGPKGPACQAKPGIFFASLASGRPVVALSFATSHRMRVRSWDRFFVPLPFGRCDLVFAPIIPKATHKDQKETFLCSVEDALNKATLTANHLCGLIDKD